VDGWSVLAAFAGGVWGAAVGAVPAFIVTGLLAMLGAVSAQAGHPELIDVAFGTVFGPQVSFAGGVAAAAFAARRGIIPTGRDIGLALMGLGRADVLIVGGAFGVLGWWLNVAAVKVGIGAWTDSIALTVIVTNLIARLLFGRTGAFGTPSNPTSRRFSPDDSATWLPWQERWGQVITISAAVGAVGAYLAAGSGLQTAADALAFGIATLVLIFLIMGRKVPVTHHMALPAALGVLHGAGFVGGVLCGVLGGLIGEAASRLFLIHGDTHIDPPAAGIAAVAFLLQMATAIGWLAAR
jgi:hypothetical protein